MRVAFSATGMVGHLVPMFPLLRAFVARGHEVAVITSGDLEQFVHREATPQATVLAAGPSVAATMQRMAAEVGTSPASEPVPAVIAEFFAGRLVDAGIDAATAAGAAWAPDLVIAETMDHLGPFVAAAAGVPLYRHTFGPTRPPQVVDALHEVVTRRAARWGRALAEPSAVIDIFPAALQGGVPAPGRRIPLRPEIHGGSRLRGDVVADPARRHALVTFGTVFTDPGIRDRAAGSLDTDLFDVVVTTGGAGSPSEPRPGLTYLPFTPLGDLVPAADVVVTTGGAGTVLSALRAGVPMVVLPQGADHEINAARARAAGVAVVVRAPAEVGPAATVVATEPGFRLRAAQVAAEVASLPPAAEVARRLEQETAVRAH